VDGAHNNIVLLTDSKDEHTNLGRMIKRFRDSFSRDIAVVDLHDIDIKGGCLGCVSCSFDYRCVYTGKDGFIDFYQDTVANADILVYAGSIQDRYLSSKWKQFFDRRFFMTHTPTLTGKQVGFIISGPLGQIANLRQILTTSAELENANLAGIVTDEHGDSATIDTLLQNLAGRLVTYAGKGYVKPSTFLGVGGRKIFRDDMFGRLRFPFLADYRYYEEHGYFDFPHNDPKRIEYCDQMIAAIGDPAVREQIRKMLKAQGVAPLQKIVETE
jgi:multimeric flavodoxin WrbA